MKINEIVTEGPIWQGVKQVGAGLGQIGKGVAQGVARNEHHWLGSRRAGCLARQTIHQLAQTIRGSR